MATYGGGLDRFDRDAGTFEHFTRRDGLPSDAVYSVLPDGDGRFWLPTNHGLSRFDPRTSTFRNYGAEDGLGGIEFNGRSFFASDSGEMFFGGMHGFNRFHPRDVRDSTYIPPVVFTAFSKFDQPQEFDLALNQLDEIVLSYRDRFFSFEFAALDYSNPQKNRYAYKLEGFDEDWIASGTRRFASYTNLDGGRYTFKVKGSNGDGVWNQEPASIEVVVIPPPWKTGWAYGLYLLAAAGGVFGYVRFQTRRHQRQLSRQRAELEQQRALAERLRQIDRMKDEFLANTSHELRTPLNGIIGIAESLLDGATGELARDTRSNLTMVAGSGRRLAHLVDDILDFSKLKNHQIELRRTAVGMRELVDVVLTLSRPLVAGKTVELRNELSRDLPPVDGDENRLQQILHKLVGNAVKFTETGHVAVSGERRDGTLEVAVADTGIGIAPEKLGKIFESFEQADASSAREYGGTGLGLTVSRQLVELHGGGMRVESEPGQGSRILFTVPLWRGETEVAAPRPAQPLARVREVAADQPAGLALPAEVAAEAAVGETTGERGRVLIVDDEPINLQVLRNILGLASYAVTEALDGPRALEIVETGEPPDVILLDVMMPKLTGFEVTRRLRRRFSGNQLPIILVTAKNQVSDLEEGLSAGANDYLTKPFSKNELLARIRTHLSLSRAHSVEAENARKTEELEQARRIQLSLLPAEAPAIPYLDVAAYMQTATEVGGDYYDFFPQADGALYVVTGDATGHGISAGMIVSMTKSALRALEVSSPHVLLGQLNGVIRAVHLERMQMALNVAYFTESEVALSSAGMPPLFRYRAATGEVEEILVPGLPLGA